MPGALDRARRARRGGQDSDERRDLLGGGVADDLDALRRNGVGDVGGDVGVGELGHQSGMFPCFLGGSVSRLVRRARSALVTFIRVFEGVMTVSM